MEVDRVKGQRLRISVKGGKVEQDGGVRVRARITHAREKCTT